MAKFIKLTGVTPDTNVCVNMEFIESMSEEPATKEAVYDSSEPSEIFNVSHPARTCLYIFNGGGQYYAVKESIDEILKLMED